MKLRVVDDDPLSQRSQREMVEAWAMVHQCPHDLIRLDLNLPRLDLNLPRLDGLACCRRLWASTGEQLMVLKLTASGFAKSDGATFRDGSGTGIRAFLPLSDSTAGFLARSDAVVEITGCSGPLANLAVV